MTTATPTDLNKILQRVRQLTERAEHPIADGATPEERAAEEIQQATARKMADALMLRYAIDEAQLDKSRPASERSKPRFIDIELTGDWEMLGYVAGLASSVARHCRCKIRLYYGSYHDGTYWARVYGFDSDVRYFEVLYTTLRLHMVGAFRVKPDPSKSYQINCYELHRGGLNWLDIAKAYGWTEVRPEPGESQSGMYVNRESERHPWSKVIAPIKRAYRAEIERRGELPIHIPPGGMKTFRRSAAQGYINRIGQRLRAVSESRNDAPGAGIVLRSRVDDLDAFFKEQNADLFQKRETIRCERCDKAASGFCRAHKPLRYNPEPYSQAGYAAGVSHANRASLNHEASSNKTREIS